jgi:hypothetical protein
MNFTLPDQILKWLEGIKMVQSPKIQKHNTLTRYLTVLGWLAMFIFACHACTRMVGASDTWKAIAAGRHYINHGVDAADPFSENSRKAGPTPQNIKTWPKYAQWIANKVDLETVKYWHPTGWINQNWLTGVIFYWLTYLSPLADAETFSFNTLVYWKFAIYIITVICVYYTAKTLGGNSALSAAFACFAMFISRSFLAIRPADFTNLLTAVFLLILVLTTYRNVSYIWFIIPLAVLWCNLHGGYIYLFIMLVPFVLINLITSFFPKKFVSIGAKGVVHTAIAGLVAFVATILFNPFHLTNLTHIFVISVGKDAKQWRTTNEWHPAFEWSNPVGDARPFLVMLILALSVLSVWVIVWILTARLVSCSAKSEEHDYGTYQAPWIDLATMVIAALTIYMAIRSRRFIPIAAIAACPIIAVFVDQILRAVSAMRNFYRQKRLFISPVPHSLQLFFVLFAAAAVLFFGTWWGLKFKRVYLDPWPNDTQFNSVFMRMTASDSKPFYACKFIKDNKLKGNIFTYWTEADFVASRQQPDPNTGRTPLQLFMDGRAQTAYETRYMTLWSKIMTGGPIAQSARKQKRELTDGDYAEIGRWINDKLREYDVWVVLMPSNMSNIPFLKGLETNPDWQLIYFDNKHKLFVDITTARGKELLEGALDGRTVYPDDFSKNLIIAHNALLFEDSKVTKESGLDFAVKAFQANPSLAPMQEIRRAAKFKELQSRVDDFCRDYIEDFDKNKKIYAGRDGYGNRISAASAATNYLQRTAVTGQGTEFYADKSREYKNELRKIQESKRW